MTERLDVYLVSQKIAKSRTLAATLIKDGKIEVDGEIIKKPSYTVDETTSVKLVGDLPKYVSRGGLKLEFALEEFQIDVSGKICLDIGASTGGFTDCLLKHGAKRVFAVDVGTLQLSDELKSDDRVMSLENLDIRSADESVIPQKVDFVCVDVSFISLTQIIGEIKRFINDNSEIVLLVKPQFEAGKRFLGKNGVIKDEKVVKQAVKKVIDFAVENDFVVKNQALSPILGGEGNREFLVHLGINVGFGA